jgi:ribosome production factor 2
MESRAPKEVEDPRVSIFVKGTHVGEVLNNVMKELVCSHP